MKKIPLLISIFLLSLFSIGAQNINYESVENTKKIESSAINFFITNYYHQLKNDATIGDGSWLNSLSEELIFEGQPLTKKELTNIIVDSTNPIQILSEFEEMNNQKLVGDFLECDEVRICFATPFLENPMSYFGHVFIEFYKKDNPLFSYVLSYLGDTENVSTFDIYTKATIGTLNGKYSIQPFYIFYNKYIVNENRNIISYKIDLTDAQKKDLISTVSNGYYNNKNYSFVFNNCMDGLLRILNEVEGLEIPSSFINSPSDLVNKLSNANLLSDKLVYASYTENQNNMYYSFSKKEKNEFNVVMSSDDRIQYLDNLENQDRQKIASLLSSYYYYDFHHNNSYNDDYHQVINYTATNLPLTTDKIDIIIPKSTGFIQLDYLYDFENNSKLHLTFRPLFSDIGEQYYGNYNQGAIEIGKLEASFDNDSFAIDEILWIKLLSINKISRFQKKLSWRFEAKNKSIENKFPFILEYDLGYSLGTKNMYLFGYLGNTVQANTLNYTAAVGASFYYIVPRKLILNLNFKESFFSDLEFKFDYEGDANLNYFITDNIALNSSFSIPSNDLTVGFKYYFNLI